MLGIMKPMKVKVLPNGTLLVKYKSRETTPIFDLCDYNGKLVETGVLESNKTSLNIKDLMGGAYYLFVLDGPHIFTERFAV